MDCFNRRIAGYEGRIRYERKRGARVGDNGSTSYVATHADDLLALHLPRTRALLGIFDRGLSRGARIMGNLQKRKGTRGSSTRKGQALHAGNA